MDRGDPDARGVGGPDQGKHADHRDERGDREGAVTEQLQTEQGRGLAALDGHEQRQERCCDHEPDDHLGLTPTDGRSLDHGEQQCEERDGDGGLPGPVQGSTFRRGGVACAAKRHSRAYQRHRDDGIGGADPEGHGLIGLRDRATALGGQLGLTSEEGRGTTVSATLPVRLR